MSGIREVLAAEAAEAEARLEAPPGAMQRARTGGASQVYTMRMPADRLAELRAIANQSGEQPSALMRRWVLERLDAESTSTPELAQVQRALTDVLHTLDRITHQRPA